MEASSLERLLSLTEQWRAHADRNNSGNRFQNGQITRFRQIFLTISLKYMLFYKLF